MNFDLAGEQRMILDSLGGFLVEKVQPMTERIGDSRIEKPQLLELLQMLLPFGIGNGWCPKEAGGMGLDALTSGLLYERVAQVAPELAGTALINEATAMLLHQAGTQEMKRTYLGALLRAEIIGCAAITEPNVGSNVANLKTRAIAAGDDYLVSGEKTWISNGDHSDFAIVVVRTGGEDEQELSMLLVDRDQHGYESRDVHKLGLKGWSTASLFLAEARVPKANLLGKEGAGLYMTLKTFERVRCFVGAVSCGIAGAALEAAVRYAQQREQWGKRIGGHQLIQAMIAEMATELDCARLLSYRAMSLVDKGERCDTQTSMAKWYATEAAVDITSKAIEIHGAYGLSTEFPLERHFRNARMLTIPDGTTEIQKLIIGRNILGIAAFADTRHPRAEA